MYYILYCNVLYYPIVKNYDPNSVPRNPAGIAVEPPGNARQRQWNVAESIWNPEGTLLGL